MDIYACKNYREALTLIVSQANGGRKRGALARIAAALKVHTTFVSQVLSGKSEFNSDQLVGFCRYFTLDDEATSFMLDLLGRDRAATAAARSVFEQRIKAVRDRRDEIASRMSQKSRISDQDRMDYYLSWRMQAVHMLAQRSGGLSAQEASTHLDICAAACAQILERLSAIGVVKHISFDRFLSTENYIHMAKQDPLVAHVHASWRSRTLQELHNPRDPGAFHYSSAISLDEVAAKQIRQVLLEALSRMTDAVKTSGDSQVNFLGIDFYRLTDASSQ
jgi:hypothetical protein